MFNFNDEHCIFVLISVIRAKILERKQTGNTQLDDVIYTVKMIEDYKVNFVVLEP